MAQLQPAQGVEGRRGWCVESQALQVQVQIRQAWLAHCSVLIHGAADHSADDRHVYGIRRPDRQLISPIVLTFLARADANPRRRMVAGVRFIAYPGIHARLMQIRTQRRIEQQMVDPQPGIFLPMLTEIVPERVEPVLRVQMPQRIRPALIQQALITCATLRLQQRVLEPGAVL